MSNNNITIDKAVPHSNDELGAKLNIVNYANFIGFIVNVILTLTSTNGILPGSSNTVDLSLKYQTFVTPKSTGFTIWVSLTSNTLSKTWPKIYLTLNALFLSVF